MLGPEKHGNMLPAKITKNPKLPTSVSHFQLIIWVCGVYQIPQTQFEIGCRGGNRYFEEVRGFLEIPKVQKNGFPQIPIIHANFKGEFAKHIKIPPHSWFMHKWSTLLEKITDFMKISYDFAFCQNNWFVRIIP